MSSSWPKAGALLVAVLQLSTRLALGGRSRLQGPEEGQATTLRSFRSDREDICGAPEIWRRITGDPSVEGVQNINWQKVDAIIEERLAAWSGGIAKLEVETQGLEARVAEKKAREGAKAMPTEAVTRLITQSLGAFASATEGREGLENAQRTMCGKPGSRPRAPRHAYKSSQEAFAALAGEYFKDKVRCSGEDFLAECARLLPAGSGEQESYCPQLCQYFKDTAQELSDAVAGETAGKGSDKLEKELEEKLEELAAIRSARSTCEGARDFIGEIREQTKTQKKAIEARFGDYQVAEENLEDASWSLEDLRGHLDDEQLGLDAAEEALKKSGVEVAEAEASLAALRGEEAKCLAALKDLAALAEAARRQLSAAKEADRVAVELKGMVSKMALMMHMLFQKRVLEPLDEVGLGSAANMSEYTEQDVEELEAAGGLRGQLETLAGYCQGEAKEAFAAVRDQVNLEGLCDFEEPSAVFSELSDAVQRRRENMAENVEKLQSWMDPLKGQGGKAPVTPAKVEGFVALGEPEGLRRIVAVFSNTAVFRDYLKHWLHPGKGKFLQLLKRLSEVVSKTDESLAALGAKTEALQAELASVLAKLSQAKERLDEAAQRQGVDAQSKAALEKTVGALAAGAQKLEDDKRRLEEEVRRAKQLWDASKEELVKAHREATSLLESWAEAAAPGEAPGLPGSPALLAEQGS